LACNSLDPLKHILVIPSWYPTLRNQGHGVFIKKHVLEISKYSKVNVLYFDVGKHDDHNRKSQSQRINQNLEEIVVPIDNSWGSIYVWFQICYWYTRLAIFGRLRGTKLIHLHVPYHIGVFLFPFMILTSKPLIISEHWSGYFAEDGRYDKLPGIIRKVISWLYNKSCAISTVSKVLADTIAEKTACGKSMVQIPNVFNLNLYPRSIEHIEHGTFLMVCNMNDREKNITGVLDALATLRREYDHVRLHIAGDGQDFEAMKSHARQHGLLDGTVVFHGFLDPNQLENLYGKSSCYILNSRFETFSISTFEAIMQGVPVISTKCKGPEEFVNESNGILIDIDSKEQLVSAMKQMLSAYQKYDPQTVRNSLSPDYFTEIGIRFNYLYENCLNSRS
jgi:glycosyltransferase involved in cell wall biosynthesis